VTESPLCTTADIGWCGIFLAPSTFFHRQLKRDAAGRSACLNFRGGVLLPTLAGMFPGVTCVDLEKAEASQVVEPCRLDNVKLLTQDIRCAQIASLF